ncbi:hypothetical protein UCRPC4_g06831 [Phaeomoniella chlamydospora]|uniref:Uncharacterized protein n=1 Tax=Phaeomoniella chlamydospora TaxID=158046 RepID=A0A0G2GAG2_PHACM|nr:hypothetical protein UCRPC4_g06831 [Phaeomoniella chlamydospora]
MLVRGLKRLVAIIGPLVILAFIGLRFYDKKFTALPSQGRQWIENIFASGNGRSQLHTTRPVQQDNLSLPGVSFDQQMLDDARLSQTHRVVYSASTKDRKFFPIVLGDEQAINPNIIPHPILDDTWIIVAQLQRSEIKTTVWAAELVCNAKFTDGKLSCTKAPTILPIASTVGDSCTGDLALLNFNIGPHDARIFYGPRNPFAVYGSQSSYTCFGQWIMDFRVLIDWGFEPIPMETFRLPTELHRPLPYSPVEKNWFIFWDTNHQMYVHYDILPTRIFAKLEIDGSIGQDIAPLSSANDAICMAMYMPKLAPELESIHQATNSLRITLCKRSDPTCQPNDFNTFIMTIFHYKTFYNFHSLYEPYVLLFQQSLPFSIHAISTKPIWINGRGLPGQGRKPAALSSEEFETWDQTEMLYVTSMSWKQHGQKYDGYVDDIIFLGFGIEDSATGGIDIVAGDLLQDLGLCSAQL